MNYIEVSDYSISPYEVKGNIISDDLTDQELAELGYSRDNKPGYIYFTGEAEIDFQDGQPSAQVRRITLWGDEYDPKNGLQLFLDLDSDRWDDNYFTDILEDAYSEVYIEDKLSGQDYDWDLER